MNWSCGLNACSIPAFLFSCSSPVGLLTHRNSLPKRCIQFRKAFLDSAHPPGLGDGLGEMPRAVRPDARGRFYSSLQVVPTLLQGVWHRAGGISVSVGPSPNTDLKVKFLGVVPNCMHCTFLSKVSLRSRPPIPLGTPS